MSNTWKTNYAEGRAEEIARRKAQIKRDWSTLKRDWSTPTHRDPDAVHAHLSGPVYYEHPAPRKARVETNHTFHLLMSILTLGMWAVFVWPWVSMLNASRNVARGQ